MWLFLGVMGSGAQTKKPTPQKTTSTAVAPLDSQKYHDVRKAAMQVKSALSVGTSYREFGPLVQNLQTEIEMLAKPKSSRDTKVVNEFHTVLDLYKGSLDAWKKKLENGSLAPEGGIWVPWLVPPETLDTRPALVLSGIKKYGVPIYPLPNDLDLTVLKGTGYVRADDLIQAYWSDAGKHLATIDEMFE
jgi:hypothetical protein